MNIVIITGASSGIGLEFAKKLDSGFHTIDEFWLVARREDKLKEAAALLRHRTRLFPMDITDSTQLDVLEDAVIRQDAVVRMLINCAGYGLLGGFCEQDTEAELGMIRLNCLALTELTHRMIPYMRRNSRIIQLASSAAFLPQPDFAVYAASKAYVLSFARALGRELEPFEIWVTCVCPGPVDTPFFDIAEQGGSTLAIKKRVMVSAEKVVEQALRDSYLRREISVYSLPIRAMHVLTKVFPHRAILDLMDLMKKG